MVRVTLLLLALVGAEDLAASLGRLTLVPPSDLHAESGTVSARGNQLALRQPMFRAVVPGSGNAVRLDFTYLGPSQGSAPLASGELRRQIGVKLRARDTCNVVYVMWHIAPTSGIFVETKLNPQARTHVECRDRGYARVRPIREASVAPIRAGKGRSLSAVLDGRVLRVLVDGSLAWEGLLPEEVLGMRGPAGLRSDNGEFDVELWADPTAPAAGRGQARDERPGARSE